MRTQCYELHATRLDYNRRSFQLRGTRRRKSSIRPVSICARSVTPRMFDEIVESMTHLPLLVRFAMALLLGFSAATFGLQLLQPAIYVPVILFGLSADPTSQGAESSA